MSSAPNLVPLGLITQPNKYGQYPSGAMSRALNVCMRDPGILSSMPAERTFRADVIAGPYSLRRLWPSFDADTLLAIGNSDPTTWAIQWVASGSSTNVTASFAFQSGTVAAQFAEGKAHCALARNRYFCTPSNLGPLALDSTGDTTARLAGLPALQFNSVNTSTTNAVAVPADTSVRWRFVWRRVFSDGYEIQSEPSFPIQLNNPSGGVDVNVDFIAYFGTGGTRSEGYVLIAGDIIEMYRTEAKPDGDDPGDTYYLAKSYTVTSTDISNNNVTITDDVIENALGLELYTNPGQPKITQGEATPPGLAHDAFTYDGRTFYLVTRPQNRKSFKINNAWGSLTTATDIASGIGRRTTTGDTALGNTTITGVASTAGIVPGQLIAATGGAFVPGTRVVSVGVGTITASLGATATLVGASLTFDDVIEMAGQVVNMASPTMMLESINRNRYVVTADRVLQGDLDNSGALLVATDVEFGTDFIVRRPWYGGAVISARATNGSHYSPALPEISQTAADGTYDERFNRWMFSKEEQPEAVPQRNYVFVGQGVNYRGIGTKDAAFIFASDGLWRMVGADGEYRRDRIDPKLILAARNAVDVLDGDIWAYTNEGLVSINSAGGVTYISRGVVGDDAHLPGAKFADTWDTYLACDEKHHEVWLTFRSGGNSVSYVYNTLTKSFVTVDTANDWSAMAYSQSLRSLVMGVSNGIGGEPDVLYFELDTSTTRLDGADWRFLPDGMGDPFTLKQFIGVDHIFSGVSTDMTLVPSYDGTNYTALTVAASTKESRCKAPVPADAPAIGTCIAPGCTLSAGGTTNLWSWRGARVTWVPVAEDSHQ